MIDAIVNWTFLSSKIFLFPYQLYLDTSFTRTIMHIKNGHSTCPFQAQPTPAPTQRSRKPRVSFSEFAAEIFASKMKSKSKSKNANKTPHSLDIPSSKTSRPFSLPPPYSSLDPSPPQSSRRSSYTPFRPSEPWTSPPNQRKEKSEAGDHTPPSPFPRASVSSGGRQRQDSNPYVPTTAWERIGERRARDTGMAW
jgi:hypothetical protein